MVGNIASRQIVNLPASHRDAAGFVRCTLRYKWIEDMAETSSTMERDARLLHADGHGEVNPGEIAIGVIIGRTSEFFDFFVYAIASVLVFPKLVFPISIR
jgi:hypothetical protein